MAFYDIVMNERIYQRGSEVWRERDSDERPRRCMPEPIDGWAKEVDVLALCERVL